MFVVSTLPKRFFGLIACLGLMAGCVKSPLKKNITFTPLSEQATSYEQTIHDVTLRAHKLSSQECKKLVGAKKPSATNIIQVDVTNNQREPWALNKKDLDTIRILPEDVIAERFQPKIKRALVRATGFLPFVLVLAYLPGAITCSIFAYSIGSIYQVPCYKNPLFLDSLLSVAFLIGTATACATLTNICMDYNKEKLDAQLRKAIQHISPEALVVQPGTTQSMLLFVDGKHLPPSFDITIREANNPANTRTFSVCI